MKSVNKSNHPNYYTPLKVVSFQMFVSALPARGSNKSCSSDGGNGGVLVVIVLDAFEGLQINNTKHGQRQADRKE